MGSGDENPAEGVGHDAPGAPADATERRRNNMDKRDKEPHKIDIRPAAEREKIYKILQMLNGMPYRTAMNILDDVQDHLLTVSPGTIIKLDGHGELNEDTQIVLG